MPRMLKALRECWSLPSETPVVQRLLLNRQLHTIFRIVPIYAISNGISGTALIFKMQPWLGAQTTLWSALLCLTNLAWGVHAWLRARTAQQHGPLFLEQRDAYISGALNGVCGIAFGWALWVWSKLPLEEGIRILMTTYVPGLMATGVLANIALPMLSAIWLSTLSVGAAIAILRASYLIHAETISFLFWYAGMLGVALLGVSRLLVWLFQTELQAEQKGQTIALLLGDFEAGANDWLWETDRDGRLTRVGQQMGTALNRDLSDLAGRMLPELFATERLLVAPSDGVVGADALQLLLRANTAFNSVLVEADIQGVHKSWQLRAKPQFAADGVQSGWRGVATDRTDARAREVEVVVREQHLRVLAMRDPLTGLPNRRAFIDYVTQVCESPMAMHSAVMLVDLDNFKAVNDVLGRSAGDLVLQHVVARFEAVLEPGDFLCRLGGDEFAIVIQDLPQHDLTQTLSLRAERLLQQLRTPDAIHQFQIDVRGSIGATWMREANRSYGELLREADIALYEAKNNGRDTHRIYSACMGASARQRLSIVSELAAAIERNQLIVVYQCIVDLASLRIIGCEALLRWKHPDYGLVSPATFIPIAEESGLIGSIGVWVLREACKAATAWPDHMSIAVNLSPKQLDNSIAAEIEEIARACGLAFARLELEITESSVVRDSQTAKTILNQLRSKGIRVAMDDFGTGYSSMGQLRDLPIDKIKLDRSFVAGLGGENAATSHSIVSSLLGLCDLMHLRVTAEGVETLQEFEELRRMQCQSVQGFYLARPMEQAALLEFLQCNNAVISHLSGAE